MLLLKGGIARWLSLIAPRPRAVCLLVFMLPWGQPLAAGDGDSESTRPVLDGSGSFDQAVRPFLQRYCVDCHGGDEPEVGLRLDRFASELEAGRRAQLWERILPQLERHLMPPSDHQPQPSQQEAAAVIDWIDRTFLHVDCTQAYDPGRVTLRRLNRTEYNNTIRDLLGVDFRPAENFPTDDVGYGFDHIGDVLTLSPLLLEKYLDAAEQIVATMLSSEHLARPHVVRFEGPQLRGTDSAKLNDLGFHVVKDRATVYREFEFPFAGDYILRTRVTGDQVGDEPVRMAFRLRDEQVFEVQVPKHRESAFFETRLSVPAGRHLFAVEFLNPFHDPSATDAERTDRSLGVHLMEVEGPFDADLAEARLRVPETYRQIVFCTPDTDGSPQECARAILTRFASRAYRRPVTEEELVDLLGLVQRALDHGETFDRGMQLAIQAVLVSPNFLFRVERDRDPHDPNRIHAIADYELAARLSYFLWSTLPDETLLELAARGELHRLEVLQRQVARMLNDPRARALVDNFAGQWLNLRSLELATPNQQQFQTFNDDLRADMRRETELLFETVMREDLSVLTFLDADFTFVNERLAAHYGMADVTGSEFRRVSLLNSPRRGVLTHASVLTLTSDPNKTSPVKRGKWVLENLLGAPPPPPPPRVPDLAVAQQAKPDATLREQLQLHRSSAACAACHQEMDPLGLALENYDAIGRWRDTDGGKPIDAAGELPSGERFRNATELAQVLRSRETQFTRHLVRSMLTYALGRGLEYYDVCAVNEITSAVSGDEYRFSRLIQAVASSRPFLMRRGDGERP